MTPEPPRRRLRRALVVLGILALLGLVGLLAAIPLVGSSERFRSVLERRASEALGRRVRVEATRLSPWGLKLTLQGLSIANPEGPALLEGATLEASPSLAALLGGDAVLKRLALSGGRLSFDARPGFRIEAEGVGYEGDLRSGTLSAASASCGPLSLQNLHGSVRQEGGGLSVSQGLATQTGGGSLRFEGRADSTLSLQFSARAENLRIGDSLLEMGEADLSSRGFRTETLAGTLNCTLDLSRTDLKPFFPEDLVRAAGDFLKFRRLRVEARIGDGMAQGRALLAEAGYGARLIGVVSLRDGAVDLEAAYSGGLADLTRHHTLRLTGPFRSPIRRIGPVLDPTLEAALDREAEALAR